MDREIIIKALEKLEQNQHNPNGYSAGEILNTLNIEISRETEKCIRGKLRSMILKKLYPEFATAGNEDIVYCPKGKSSGLYRLSKYREK